MSHVLISGHAPHRKKIKFIQWYVCLNSSFNLTVVRYGFLVELVTWHRQHRQCKNKPHIIKATFKLPRFYLTIIMPKPLLPFIQIESVRKRVYISIHCNTLCVLWFWRLYLVDIVSARANDMLLFTVVQIADVTVRRGDILRRLQGA